MNRYGRDFHGGRAGWNCEGRRVSRDYDREYGDRCGAYHGRSSGVQPHRIGAYPGNRGYDAVEGYRFGNWEDRGGFRRMVRRIPRWSPRSASPGRP